MWRHGFARRPHTDQEQVARRYQNFCVDCSVGGKHARAKNDWRRCRISLRHDAADAPLARADATWGRHERSGRGRSDCGWFGRSSTCSNSSSSSSSSSSEPDNRFEELPRRSRRPPKPAHKDRLPRGSVHAGGGLAGGRHAYGSTLRVQRRFDSADLDSSSVDSDASHHPKQVYAANRPRRERGRRRGKQRVLQGTDRKHQEQRRLLQSGLLRSAYRRQRGGRKLLVWDVFTGTGSLAQMFEVLMPGACRVVSVDKDAACHPDVVVDFTLWDFRRYIAEEEEGRWPDHIHLSPECRTFSRQANPAVTGRSATNPAGNVDVDEVEEANFCVAKMRELICAAKQESPQTTFSIENPRHGFLWKFRSVKALIDGQNEWRRVDIDYCQYDMPYMKPTTILTNLRTWRPNRPLRCTADARCPVFDGTGHPRTPMGTAGGILPPQLCAELVLAVRAAHRGGAAPQLGGSAHQAPSRRGAGW